MAAEVPPLPRRSDAGPRRACAETPLEDTRNGPTFDEARTPLFDAVTLSARGPTDAETPRVDTRTFATRGPIRTPLVEMRTPGTLIPKPIYPKLTEFKEKVLVGNWNGD
jgi:hypothetical protein